MRHGVVVLALLALIEVGCTTTIRPTPDTIALREALRREPESLEARASLGLALYAMGDVDGAVEELQSLLRQHPDAVQARLTLASALMARHQWPAAQQELAEVIRREPDSTQAHYSLGVVRYAQGDVQGAAEAYRRVLARSPDHHDARYNLALMLKLSHKETEATPEFLAAARAGHARAQFFAGAAYAEGLGVERDLVQAIAWWMRASAQGVIQAEDALAELRDVASGRSRRSPAEGQAVQDAFREAERLVQSR